MQVAFDYPDNNPGAPREFWDGFQWIKKPSSLAPMDPAMLSQTKKMRRVQISNLPLYLGLDQGMVQEVLSNYLVTNYLADTDNSSPILCCELNPRDKSCVIELSSVEEANRLSKLSEINILNTVCKVTRLGESMYGTTVNMASLLQNAHVD